MQAAISGSPKFFLGTDSAPHTKHKKETCGHAGCYTSFASLELYAEAFELAGALDKLPAFASEFGAAFYGIAPTSDSAFRLELTKKQWTAPQSYPFGSEIVQPLRAGYTHLTDSIPVLNMYIYIHLSLIIFLLRFSSISIISLM